MICPTCHRELLADSRFCNGCGVAVEPRCSRCGQSNAADSRFCRSCGAALARIEEAASAPPATGDRPAADTELDQRAHDGERRHLTVVFCDLVGSTEFASRLDPEEWRDIVRSYQSAAAEVVSRYGGHLAQYLGDGVLAYFGWPVAHDDDAERAVRSGLALRDVVGIVNERLVAIRSPQLSVRVGVHTGPVVVADAGGAFGDTPNIAARVQAVAEPDSVWISEATHRLVSGLFIVDPIGPHVLKGVAAPLPLYRVRQPSGVRGRLGAAAVQGLTLFVGREEERRLLRARWEQVQEGDGQVVLITGEAGIGKSRLVKALEEDLAGTRHTWLECACSPFFENTPFRPVTETLQQIFGWREKETPERQIEQLVAALEAAGLAAAETVPLVAPLLGLSVPNSYPPQILAPAQERRKLLAALETWIFAIARLQPVVLVVEDLHWVDPSTLELLGLLVEQAATAPLLLVLTGRQEFHVPWPLHAHQLQLTLNRLSRRHVRAMVRQVIARAALSDEIVEVVVTRTDGVPLFVEELTRLILENEGRSDTLTREIPITLQASLTARLDRLGRAKDVAQLGAALGREFSYKLVCAVAGMPEDELQAVLETLAQAELLHPRGLPPDATYFFKHSLVQDAAYTSLLKSRRRELHQRIARVLAQKFPEQAEREPELLAHHLTEAGDAEPAVDAWGRAAVWAMARSAYAEAVGHLNRGLAVLDTLPQTPKRTQQELQMLLQLTQNLFIVKGFGAAEPAAAAARVRGLTERLGDSPEAFFTILGLCVSLNSRSEYHAARGLAEQLLAMADRSTIPGAAMWAHFLYGEARYHGGEPAVGREHFEHAVRLYPEQAQPLSLVLDPGVVTLAYAGLSACQVGFPDTGRERVRAASDLARRLGRAHDMALAESLTGILDFELREPPRDDSLERLDALIRISKEQQFKQVLVHATAQRGWTFVQQGRYDDGIAALRGSLATALETGHHPTRIHYLFVLAEAVAIAGGGDEAMALVDDALAASGEAKLEMADYLRLRADLLMRGNAPAAEVEAAYWEAIGVARQHGTRIYELRAAIHLGRWLHSQDRVAEARALVEPLYAWFTEGAETRALCEARALLEALA